MDGTRAGTPDPRGLAALILGASLLGFAAMLVRWASPAGPLAVGFYRMAIALPPVAWLAWRARGTARPGIGRARLWASVAGVCFVGDLWMWHSALHHTSAANATLLVTLAPIWVAVVSVVWLGARLRRRFWLGVGLALAGALVLGLAKGARWGTGLGELLGALASLAYGAFTLVLGRARRDLSAPEALFWVVLCCTVGFGAPRPRAGRDVQRLSSPRLVGPGRAGPGGAGGGLVAHHLGHGPCVHECGRHGAHDPARGHGHPGLAAAGGIRAAHAGAGHAPGAGGHRRLRLQPTRGREDTYSGVRTPRSSR